MNFRQMGRQDILPANENPGVKSFANACGFEWDLFRRVLRWVRVGWGFG